jgi:hypothetical protein
LIWHGPRSGREFASVPAGSQRPPASSLLTALTILREFLSRLFWPAPLREKPPRWLALLSARMIRPGATVPPALPGLHVFSPSTISVSPWPHAPAGTRWRVNGDSDPSGSARQRDVSAIHCVAAGRLRRRGQSRHPGSRLGLTSGDPRQQLGDRPRREPDGRTDGPRTRAPHGEERSEKTGGRRIGQTASDRDRGTR